MLRSVTTEEVREIKPIRIGFLVYLFWFLLLFGFVCFVVVGCFFYFSVDLCSFAWKHMATPKMMKKTVARTFPLALSLSGMLPYIPLWHSYYLPVFSSSSVPFVIAETQKYFVYLFFFFF